MKRWILVILFLGLVGWGVYKWQPWGNASGPVGVDAVSTATAEKRSIRFGVSAAGDIGPAEQVSVRPEVNGRIAQLPVDIGDTVRKDALLFTLDDRDLQIERQSQDKQVERARLQLDQAERNFRRAKELFDAHLISAELYEEASTTFELARNDLERSQKALDLVLDRIRKTRILAPFDCTVLTRPVSVGQAVSGSGGFNSGTEVLTIADLKSMVINAHINQADVTRLRAGQQVEVEVEAVPGLQVTGEVERVAPQATIRNNIKGFAARILLENVDPRVRPGMTANIKIPVSSAEDVVAVPLAAVFTQSDPETGDITRHVFVKQGSLFEKRDVQIGISDFFFAEVQRGLKAGEIVSLETPKPEWIRAESPRGGMGEAGTRLSGSRPFFPPRRSHSWRAAWLR